MTPPGKVPSKTDLLEMKNADAEVSTKPENNVLTFGTLVLNLSDSSQLQQLQLTYAKGTTPQEFGMFIGIMKSTGLNPFKKELWCVKYGTSPAQIFIGRDGYRKIAKQHPDYKGHRVDVVCAKDTCNIKNGLVTNHEYSVTDRGNIIGAYCIVKRGKLEDLMHFVDFDEYNTGKSKWKESPKTMIKKVAEAQTLRMAFDDLLEGTYDESEVYSPDIIIEAEAEVIEKKGNKLQEKYAQLEAEHTMEKPLPKSKKEKEEAILEPNQSEDDTK